MTRSEIRHALYRMKNGVPIEKMQPMYDAVSTLMTRGQTWETFAVSWDITFKNEVLGIIIPETDYDFIHSTCLELAIHARANIQMEMTERQHNVQIIVETNALEGKMAWTDYNKTWGVSVDRELKRINTRLFKTVVNKVTDEMIAASAKSDGAAMTELPTVDIQMPVFKKMSKAEAKKFEKLASRKND